MMPYTRAVRPPVSSSEPTGSGAAAACAGVRLRFLMESHVDAPLLREGAADLEVGVIDTRSPEVHHESLYEDHMVGVVRPGHPLLSGELTPARFAAADHLTVSRRGRMEGPVDTALAELGLRRRVVGSVGTFPSSLFLLLDSDLVSLATVRTRTLTDTLGLRTFEVPLPLPPLPFGLAWHPRHDADPAHAWLRRCFRELLAPVNSLPTQAPDN